MNYRFRLFKRIAAVLLALALFLTGLPQTAFAIDSDSLDSAAELTLDTPVKTWEAESENKVMVKLPAEKRLYSLGDSFQGLSSANDNSITTFHANNPQAKLLDNGNPVDTLVKYYAHGTVLYSHDEPFFFTTEEESFLCYDGLSLDPYAEYSYWELTMTEPVDIYCVWYRGVEINVDAGGGYFGNDPDNTAYVELLRIGEITDLLHYWSNVTPPKSGKSLVGWSWSPNGSNPFTEFTPDEDMQYRTLYAVWPDDAVIPVTNVSFPEPNVSIVIGKTKSCPATVAPASATYKKVTYTSSDESVVTVDTNGIIKGKRAGTAVITAAASNGKKATLKVQVLFTDVTKSHDYYYTPVYWAANHNPIITAGYADGSFGVDLNCQRRELLIFMWRYAGCPTKDKNGKAYDDARERFNDMNAYAASSASNQAIAWAYKEGIVNGYSDGGIHPKDPIARKDVMIMLYRLAGKPAVEGTLIFPDCKSLKTTSDTYKAILWGSKFEITKGYSSGPHAGQFGINLNCLREQIVTFLYRYETKWQND